MRNTIPTVAVVVCGCVLLGGSIGFGLGQITERTKICDAIYVPNNLTIWATNTAINNCKHGTAQLEVIGPFITQDFVPVREQRDTQ
jgi:hypothetical protein